MDVQWTWRPSLKLFNGVQWCSMDPLYPFPMFNGHVQWIQWIQWMSNGYIWADPMDTITKTSLRANITLVFLSNGSIVSIGSIEHHWTCPLSIGFIEHRVHWTLRPLDTMSIGSIMSIELRVHWTLCPLNMDTMFNGLAVQWIQWIQWTLVTLLPKNEKPRFSPDGPKLFKNCLNHC